MINGCCAYVFSRVIFSLVNWTYSTLNAQIFSLRWNITVRENEDVIAGLVNISIFYPFKFAVEWSIFLWCCVASAEFIINFYPKCIKKSSIKSCTCMMKRLRECLFLFQIWTKFVTDHFADCKTLLYGYEPFVFRR